MNFLPGWFPGAAGAAGAGGGEITLELFDYGESLNQAYVDLPSGIQAGDLILFADIADFQFLDLSVDVGYTLLGSTGADGDWGGQIAFKVAAGNEVDIFGSNGLPLGNGRKIGAILRPSVPISSASAHSGTGQITNSNPSAQNISSGGGTPPLVVAALFGVISGSSVSGMSFNPSPDGIITTSLAGANSQLILAWKFYPSAPANVSVDMNDSGSGNCLVSGYIQLEMT